MNEVKFTSLHEVAGNGNLLDIQRLVEDGCDLNSLDANRCTPLDYAIAKHNSPEIIEYMVKHGAKRALDVILRK